MEYKVASSHPLSTGAGMEVMSKGGNAYDAMLAVSSCLVVVQPQYNGLGGDLFATVKDGGYYSINASGYAAGLADYDFYSKKGYSKIPERGSLSSFSIPGLASSWEAISSRLNLCVKEDMKRAIQFADEGFEPSRKLVSAINNFSYGDEDFNSIYKGTDRLLVQKELANTLKTLSEEGFDDFYNGKIARKIEEDMKNKGGLIRTSDLSSYKAEIKTPLHIKYRNYNVYTNPPVSQGLTALVWLNSLNKYDLSSMEHENYYETLIDTMMDAYNIRRNYIYDGVKLPDDLSTLEASDSNINNKGTEQSDTTAYSIYDGKVEISAIQSNYMGFGSGQSIKGTGINMNNRGSYFSMDSKNHNFLEPGKKTFHTLMSVLASGDKEILTGSMGGDIQPQINVQILSRIIDLGYNIQDAVSYPRFAYPASIYGKAKYPETADDIKIYYESMLRLNKYEAVNDLNDMMGHAQGITVGTQVETGTDPRGDGLLLYMKSKYFK
ncbi:MAG: gamma-glutamyltransferase [Ferroplasma sp.]